jgi:hypothetical protein
MVSFAYLAEHFTTQYRSEYLEAEEMVQSLQEKSAVWGRVKSKYSKCSL